MTVSKFALATALAFGGAGIVFAPAADAQRAPGSGQSRSTNQQDGEARERTQAQPQQGQEGARQLELSPAEVAALTPLQTAVQAQDWAAALAALPAARAAAQGADARYFVERAAYVIARQTQNTELELQAIDALVDMPNTPPNELSPFLNRQAELAFAANDFAKAERAFNRLLEMTPNDERILNNLAVVRSRMGDTGGALDAIRQTVETAEAAGQRAEENAYRRLLAAAVEANRPDLIVSAAERLVRAYPSGDNWRNALVLLRQTSAPDATTNLDIYRLQRATGALAGEQDYVLFAEELNRGGLPGEAQAVLQEGISRNQISAATGPVRQLSSLVANRIDEDRASLAGQQRQAAGAANGRLARAVGDALYGYGRYADAAEMYRLALQKGGEDTNLLNTRLGAALALAGQRSEAEAAFRAVSGPRQALANYWLLWLANRTG